MVNPQEDADQEIVITFFETRQLKAERFSAHEIGVGKTPDFKIKNAAGIVAYCEMKSPQDIFNERLEETIKKADGKIAGIIESGTKSRQYRCIERAAKKAAIQFDAVNAPHSVPNILAIVNHDRYTKCHDFEEVLTGCFKEIRTGQALRDEIPQIDVYIWIDGESGKIIGRIFRHENPLKETVRNLLALE